MFRAKKGNRTLFFIIFLIIFSSSLFLFGAQPISNNKIDDQSPTNYNSIKSSSTIESTTITKRTYASNYIDVNMPYNRPNGDLYIAQIIMDDDLTIYSPYGWTLINNEDADQTGRDVRLATYWRIGYNEHSSYRWSCNYGYTALWIGVIYRISSFDTNNPIQVSSISELNAPGSSTPTAPSVTTTTDDSLILRMFAADNYNTAYPYWPSGTTGLFQDHCGYDSVMGASAYQIQSTAGSSGSAQFTMGATNIWVATTIAITPEPEQIPPTFSNLEETDPLELGDTETINITVTDESGINQVQLEFGGSNHSMTRISGDIWQYNWTPSSIGIKPYTIWMEDNFNNINSTSGSILVRDTTAPTYSDLIESADPLALGQNETISIKIYDNFGTGVAQVLLEYESSNHTMNNIVGDTWSWSNWKPSSLGTFPYRIHMKDNQDNWNVTEAYNITVIITSGPIIGNLTESADPLELGSNITISIDVFGNQSSVSTVFIELEDVNYTMIYDTGDRYNYTWNSNAIGIMIYKIHANNSGDVWSKFTSSFDIIDTTVPTLDVPLESENILELGDTELISVNATDLGGIINAKIEFDGNNHSMVIIGNTCNYDFWTPNTVGLHYYTIYVQDNSNNWGYTIGNITVQDNFAPVYSNLTVSPNPIEIGEILTIEIIAYDIAEMQSVKIEYEGANRSMISLGGDKWHYDDWEPIIAGNYSFVIHMQDKNDNWNTTSGSVIFRDTIMPSCTILYPNSTLELGQTASITAVIGDNAGINMTLIEFEGSNHTMDILYGDIWQYNSWTPTYWTTYQYKIHVKDINGNTNFTIDSINVEDTMAPPEPIITNAPSGEVSGVLTFDWLDGSDPSGISYYLLIIDNESDPFITPGYIFVSNITNSGPQSSYLELDENLLPGSYYFFLIQIDGVGHQSSYTMGSFTIVSNDFLMFIIIGLSIASIASVTAFVVVRKRHKNDLPRKKKIPLKLIISHIEDISNSSQITEKSSKQKVKKQKVKAPEVSMDDKELMIRIDKIKAYGEKLFNEGAYLEAQKQFEFAEKILIKLGKTEAAAHFTNLKIGIKEISEERDKKLQKLEKAKYDNKSLEIFELYNDLIELSKELKDEDSASMYLYELTEFYKTDQITLRDLEFQRFNLYKEANSFMADKKFDKSAELYLKCEKISQFLVKIGRENEQKNVDKFREMINECLNKASQK